MSTDQLLRAVRRQLALGRLVPLGAAVDGAWLAEQAALGVLREAATALPGVRLESLRLALDDSATPVAASVPVPASALPPGPLRLSAEFSAPTDRPLPESATALRGALATAAEDRLGLLLAAIDLRVTGLLEEGAPVGQDTEPATRPVTVRSGTEAAHGHSTAPGTAAAAAALAVPGVVGLSGALGGPRDTVRVTDTAQDEDSPSRRAVQIQLTVDGKQRVLDVVREVRQAVATAAADGSPGPVVVAVLVTGVGTEQRGDAPPTVTAHRPHQSDQADQSARPA